MTVKYFSKSMYDRMNKGGSLETKQIGRPPDLVHRSPLKKDIYKASLKRYTW